MLILKMAKIESTGGHIKTMLVIEITKMKLTGGHYELMLIIEMAKIEINWRLYWIYANHRWPKYWIYCIYIDYQNEIRIMLIIEMPKIYLTVGHIGFIVFI